MSGRQAYLYSELASLVMPLARTEGILCFNEYESSLQRGVLAEIRVSLFVEKGY
jgi:hypothetical protein